ncbi:MAG: type II toxin-antitoxin system RelE/ParE family toxin [bacterium]
MKVEYVKRVKKFLEDIDETTSYRLQYAIENKLALDPDKYALPLRGLFKGFYKFRIGDYRAIFSINGNTILLVVLIAQRKNVYDKFKSLF